VFTVGIASNTQIDCVGKMLILFIVKAGGTYCKYFTIEELNPLY